MSTLTDDQKKDIGERIAKFKEAHQKLVADLQVDIFPSPIWVPVTPTAYGTGLSMEYMDLKYRNPSPLVNLE